MRPALVLQTVSGSPFGWKVQLALGHRAIPHALTMLSADRGDLRAPAFLALNPRGKLPVIVEGEFVLAESGAIVDYLEDAYPDHGPSLWPADPQARAKARRFALEVSHYLYPPTRALMQAWLGVGEPRDAAAGAAARDRVAEQLALLMLSFIGDFTAGASPSAADYALYPLVALLRRIATRRPESGAETLLAPDLLAWSARIEALDFFAATTPPHWRQK